MTMSITHPSVRPPTLEAAAPRTEVPSPVQASRNPTPAAAEAAAPTTARPRANDIAFDERSGFMVVRTVDVATGEVVAQNPTEAYLRLAQAMTATVRSDAAKTSDVVA